MRVLDSVCDPMKPEEVMGYMYLCPGCKMGHMLYVKRPRQRVKGVITDLFSFNQNMVHPTFHPRVLMVWPSPGENGEKVEKRCHHAVRNGKLVFEDDCTHDLAGKEVRMIVRDD